MLPEWIQEAIDNVGENKWTQALAIAWSALLHHKHIKYRCPYCEAMRDIEKLGNYETNNKKQQLNWLIKKTLAVVVVGLTLNGCIDIKCVHHPFDNCAFLTKKGCPKDPQRLTPHTRHNPRQTGPGKKENVMETLKMFNGNDQEMVKELPRIHILADHFNDTALAYVWKNTGLEFKPCAGGWEAHPVISNQIVRLLLTYNFKTQYHDNSSTKNTIYLKSDHHQGSHVDAICYECVKYNRINTNGLKQGDYLSC